MLDSSRFAFELLFFSFTVYVKKKFFKDIFFTGYDVIQALAVSDSESGRIIIFDGKGDNEPIHIIEKMHYLPVKLMEVTCLLEVSLIEKNFFQTNAHIKLAAFQYNFVYDCTISIDSGGMIEYWSGPKHDYGFPKNVNWVYKTDTDLYEFVKAGF